jgi:cytochrome c-type biogenesis protein
MLSTQLLAFMAGVLSILSPCVLPLVPIVLASALSSHRLGPLALAMGVCLSFTLIGLFLATIGFALGLSSETVRQPTGGVMVLVGIVLISPLLQNWVTTRLEPLGRLFNRAPSDASPSGLWGQFAIGLLLGAVWSPCVGPTLGAASVLAAQSKDLLDVWTVMMIFGIGAALPLLMLGQMTQAGLRSSRYALLATSTVGKKLMGAILMGLGFLILTGVDKILEQSLVDLSPDWLIRLTTQF